MEHGQYCGWPVHHVKRTKQSQNVRSAAQLLEELSLSFPERSIAHFYVRSTDEIIALLAAA